MCVHIYNGSIVCNFQSLGGGGEPDVHQHWNRQIIRGACTQRTDAQQGRGTAQGYTQRGWIFNKVLKKKTQPHSPQKWKCQSGNKTKLWGLGHTHGQSKGRQSRDPRAISLQLYQNPLMWEFSKYLLADKESGTQRGRVTCPRPRPVEDVTRTWPPISCGQTPLCFPVNHSCRDDPMLWGWGAEREQRTPQERRGRGVAGADHTFRERGDRRHKSTVGWVGKDGTGDLTEETYTWMSDRDTWELVLWGGASYTLPQQRLVLRIAPLPPSCNWRVRCPKWHTSPQM